MCFPAIDKSLFIHAYENGKAAEGGHSCYTDSCSICYSWSYTQDRLDLSGSLRGRIPTRHNTTFALKSLKVH